MCVHPYRIWHGCEHRKPGDEPLRWMLTDILMLEIADPIHRLLRLGGALPRPVASMPVSTLISLACRRWPDPVVLVLFKIIILMLVCGWVFGGGTRMHHLRRIAHAGVLVGTGPKPNLWVGPAAAMTVDGDLG